jgi:hypothetical protein
VKHKLLNGQLVSLILLAGGPLGGILPVSALTTAFAPDKGLAQDSVETMPAFGSADTPQGETGESTVGDEDLPLEDNTNVTTSDSSWDNHKAPAESDAQMSSGAAGALDRSLSVGLSLLGLKTDESSFQSGKVETRSYGFGTQVGIPLNSRHSIAVRGVMVVHDYDEGILDDKVDFALGFSARGELFQTESVLKPFLGIGLAVSSLTDLKQTAIDSLYPLEVTKAAVSLELDLGGRFWLANSKHFFFDLIAGLVRSDLYYEETTRRVIEQVINGEPSRVATEDIDRGYFLIDGNPATFLSRLEMVIGYSF